MAEQKKAPSTNGEFKTSPLGFDKAEVMAYIVQHNKERKALKEENEELKRALEEKQQTNEGQSNELTAELEKKKAADDIRHEIADVSTLVAEKMLEREIDTDDQRKFIDSFIEGIGDGDGSDKQ